MASQSFAIGSSPMTFGRVGKERMVALAWGLLFTGILAVLIVFGSRNLAHFDAALVGYTFATLFATFAITYRYAMWLRRPPTPMYSRRGRSVSLTPRFIGATVLEALRQFLLAFAANRFVFKRARLPAPAPWLTMS